MCFPTRRPSVGQHGGIGFLDLVNRDSMDLRHGISLSPWTHEVKSHYIILRYALGNSSAAYCVCVRTAMLCISRWMVLGTIPHSIPSTYLVHETRLGSGSHRGGGLGLYGDSHRTLHNH